MSLRVSALLTYPVKSCAAVHHQALAFTPRGPAGDRTWMVIDAAGRFLTQRTAPQLARLTARLSDADLHLTHPAQARPLTLACDVNAGERAARVWRHEGPVIDAGDAAAAWLERCLERPCRLVRLHPEHGRRANPDWAPPDTPVGFADGYPVLILGEASLADLNRRLGATLSMLRFRPNIVVAGAEPYAEDAWWAVRVPSGERLRWAKPCVRCTITQRDPLTGERAGKEPLKTLATYRMHEALGGPIFGANYTSFTGALRVGDPLVAEGVAHAASEALARARGAALRRLSGGR